MKKIKTILPLLVASATTGIMIPIASCAPTTNCTVTLYSDIGSFGNNQKILFLPNIPSGTRLKDAAGYVQPYFPTFTFSKWKDVEGNEIAEDTKVTSNLVLVANYAELDNPAENFTTDSWKTVTKICKQGFVEFAKAYCGFTGSSETQAKQAIIDWIPTEANIRDTYLKMDESNFVTTHVRLIGIDHDPIATNPSKNAKFTFEFTEVVGVMSFNDVILTTEHINEWHYSDGDGGISDCLLKEYLNSDEDSAFRAQLPSSLDSALVKVIKHNEEYMESQGGRTIDNDHISSDCLFPLSRMELNDWSDDDTFEDEQTPYTYYSEKTEEHDQSELRIKNYIGTDRPFNYWTRSTYDRCFDSSDNDQIYVGGVVYDGGIHPSYAAFSGLGFAPAFCLGGE